MWSRNHSHDAAIRDTMKLEAAWLPAAMLSDNRRANRRYVYSAEFSRFFASLCVPWEDRDPPMRQERRFPGFNPAYTKEISRVLPGRAHSPSRGLKISAE